MARGSGQRIFILVIVAVFFLSTFALTGIIVLDQIRSSDSTSNIANRNNSDQLTPEQEASLNEAIEENRVNDESKLEGTKLTGFEPIEGVEKLQIVDTKEGDGEEVKPGDTVTAHYTGALAKDGTIFQSSLDTGAPIPFSLNGVIEGWKEGVPGMKVGGERRLIIPAEQAYGESGTAGIPPNSDLVFDIVLVKIGE